MRSLIAAPFVATAVLALAACTPPADNEAGTVAETPAEISTAPAVGGPAALPTDEGVTPAPEALEDASAADVSAAVSPEEAAARAGGAEKAPDE